MSVMYYLRRDAVICGAWCGIRWFDVLGIHLAWCGVRCDVVWYGTMWCGQYEAVCEMRGTLCYGVVRYDNRHYTLHVLCCKFVWFE